MNRTIFGLVLFSIALVSTAQDDTSESIPPANPLPGLEAFVDGAVETAMAEYTALPGVTVSVVKDGEIILLKGYGYADVDSSTPVDPSSSIFRIGSISKTFTGLAVMQMVDRGQLDLDEDVNTYLERFQIPEAFGEAITLRHLLAHRAGFEDFVADLFIRESDDFLPMGEYLAQRMPERVRPPGKSSTYTNYGIALAGYIVEVVSGMDFATYLDENIFKPLGMDHSTIREPLGAGHPQNMRPELEALLATGYAKGPDGKPLAKPHDLIGQVAPAGAISSTAEDMARYMIARLDDDRYDGGRLVSAEMTAIMQERPYSDRPLIIGMGYAMAEGVVDGYRWRWHNGGSSSFFSDMTLYPELQLGIFISTNSSDGGSETADRIPKLIFERYFPSKLTFDPPSPPADFVNRGQKYAGQYMPTRRSYNGLEKLLALVLHFDVSVDADGYLIVKMGPQSTKYVEIEEGVFQSAEAGDDGRNRSSHLYFYEDENGVPVRISVTTNDPIRVSFTQSPSFLYLTLGLATILALAALLGAWRRARRGLDQTKGGIWASRLWVLGALAVLVAVCGLAGTVAMVAGGNLDPIIFGWPPAPLKASVYSAIALVIIAVALVVLSIYAWREPGWNRLRQVHYTAFTIVVVLLAFALNEWNFVGFNY